MKREAEKRILARIDAHDFVGRETELDRILAHAKSGRPSETIVLAAPRAGASELLRQAYDRLFADENSVVPFYFEFKANDGTARDAAIRFAHQLLLQNVAFKRRDPRLIQLSPGLDEIAELAPAADGYWIDRVIQSISGEGRSLIRTCLGAPVRAAASGSSSFVLIDDVHVAERIDGGPAFLEDLFEVFSSSSIPGIFSGRRRFLFGRKQAEIIDLEALAFPASGPLVEKLATRTRVTINEQTRDLIAVQLRGNPGHVASLLASAAANGDELNTFDDVQRAYTDAIFGGHLGRYFDTILKDIGDRVNVLKMLGENLDAGTLPLTYWKKHSDLEDAEFDSAMARLHVDEIVNVSSGVVTFDRTDVILGDHIRARSRLESGGEQRALAVGETLAAHIKRAPALMARAYRQNAAIGLRELIETFDGRQVSPVLLDYARFKQELKGAGDDKIQKAIKEDNARIRLPHIVYAAHTGDLYPPINELCDIERSAAGIGFTNASKKNNVVWLAVEVESKLEASPDVTEFWCDRLEMAAAHCGFARFKIWLIAPEGFSPDAVEVLRARKAYGSSRRQVALLADILNAEVPAEPTSDANEYEFVVPMGEDAEIMTARTIDEIAERHDMPAKATNQIKTALIEACINAAEHSLSPDGKIHQRFVVDDEKITITVTNRGVRLADKDPSIIPDEGRRGWGLKLIRGLMDSVEIDDTDDGTQITMVKYLRDRPRF